MKNYSGLILSNLIGGVLIYFASIYFADSLWFAYLFLYLDASILIPLGVMAILLFLVEAGINMQTESMDYDSKPSLLGILLIGMGLAIPFAYILLSGGWEYFWLGPIVSAILLLVWSLGTLYLFKQQNPELHSLEKAKV